MKLSEAMIKGQEFAPNQSFEGYFGVQGHACALGTAFLGAVGRKAVRPEKTVTDYLIDNFPCLRYNPSSSHTCPECNQVYLDMFGIIVHLNDEHFWNRQRIAEYVKELGE